MIARFLLSCAVVLSAFLAAPVGAQSIRPLPGDMVVTTMQANGGSIVVLGDVRVRLSPATQVRGANNLIIQPASLYGTHRVGVKRDLQGQVSRIWILTDAEYQALTQNK